MIPKYSCGSDDITFCASKCGMKNCFRHPSNMIHKNIPHSFALFKETDECPFKGGVTKGDYLKIKGLNICNPKFDVNDLADDDFKKMVDRVCENFADIFNDESEEDI